MDRLGSETVSLPFGVGRLFLDSAPRTAPHSPWHHEWGLTPANLPIPGKVASATAGCGRRHGNEAGSSVRNRSILCRLRRPDAGLGWRAWRLVRQVNWNRGPHMDFTRRTSLGLFGLSPSWLQATTLIMARSHHQNLVFEGDKVGPPPMLPPLQPRPYPNRRQYLLTDGTLRVADGFVRALCANWLARAGVARAIPYGLDIRTDEQKLWLLGRRSFALRFDGDLSDVLTRARSVPFQPTWLCCAVAVRFRPMRTTAEGKLVPDSFD